jgi:hypothetical protein
MKSLLFLLILTQLFTVACNNNRNFRLRGSQACDLEEDLVTFELTEDEVEDELFENVSTGLPSDSNFETISIIATKVEGDITTSFSSSGVQSVSPRLNVSCVDGFDFDKNSSGSFDIEVPVLYEDDATLNLVTFPFEFNLSSNTIGEPVFDPDLEPTINNSASSDIISAFQDLGYEVQLYTPVDDDREDDEPIKVFVIHARLSDQDLTLRTTLNLVPEKK